MDAIANQRYQSIRSQLDQLHYSQPFNIESSALVERLLTDLLKTTEMYQKVKNELAISTNENKLNQQALIPLQKENERLGRESNSLHFDVIKAKEDLEQVDLKWKSTLRQLQNECQDLRFLVDQKDIKIKKQDQELTKMKSKYEKILSKMYLPSQDEIVDGLNPDIQDRDDVNVMISGHNQKFQMGSPLQKQNNDLSDLVNDESFVQGHKNIGHGFKTQTSSSHPGHQQPDYNNPKKWAEELTRADERCQLYISQLEETKIKKREVEERLESHERQITLRDEEIKRLHNFYEGGQNLEKLNIRYVHETNEKTIAKLQNQVDFLNKENHRLQQQVDFLKGGKTIKDEIGLLKTQLSDLQFENNTLRKDLVECTRLLKDAQEQEVEQQHRVRSKAEDEKLQAKELEVRLREISIEHDKLKHEYERVQSLKGAYNADKKQLIDRINDLQLQLQDKDQERKEVDHRFGLQEHSTIQYKNEINFLNGKCSTLKRDLEYQEKFIQKYKDDIAKLQNESDYIKMKLDNSDRENMLLKKQLNGMQEDNDRINRLYQVAEKEAFVSTSSKPSYQGLENQKPSDPYNPLRKYDDIGQRQMPTPKGSNSKWKVVDDDFGPNTANATTKFSYVKAAEDNRQTVGVRREY